MYLITRSPDMRSRAERRTPLRSWETLDGSTAHRYGGLLHSLIDSFCIEMDGDRLVSPTPFPFIRQDLWLVHNGGGGESDKHRATRKKLQDVLLG